MGLEPSAPLADSLVRAFGAASSRVELCPGVDDALHALHDRGVRLGIICDVGFTPSSVLRALLDRSGLLTVFTGWSFSDEVGCYKPSQAIFRHALGYLDVAPERAAHIGDLRRTDIAGARAMGMTSVRYTAVHDDPDDGPEADHLLSSYAALLPLLGF